MVYYKKKGLPAEKDIVLCKIKKVLPHSVFAELIDYEGKEGMIHISELSNRWTKNINDVANLNDIIVCRVEKIDSQKGHIDLSKKRVTRGEEKQKKDEFKNETHIEKIIEHSLKKNGMDLKEFYDTEGFKLIEEYGSLHDFYEEFLEDPKILKELSFKKDIIESLKESFESVLQKSRVNLKKTIKAFANGKNGLANIKKFMNDLLKLSNDENVLEIKYLNAPDYLASINSQNYKSAEAFFDKIKIKMAELSQKYDVSVL